jgi:hypothetical protein
VWLPDRGELRAQVRWALCGQFGARFVGSPRRGAIPDIGLVEAQ